MTDGTITIEQIDRTKATDNPVYEVSGGDGSLNCIPTEEELYVPIVQAGGTMPMKTLLSAAVRHFDQTTVKFPTVINPMLEAKLDGFREEWEEHEAPEIDEQVRVLVGEWDPERAVVSDD